MEFLAPFFFLACTTLVITRVFSMTLLHSALNPLIYSFLSYGYRARLAKLWKRMTKNEGAKMSTPLTTRVSTSQNKNIKLTVKRIRNPPEVNFWHPIKIINCSSCVMCDDRLSRRKSTNSKGAISTTTKTKGTLTNRPFYAPLSLCAKSI